MTPDILAAIFTTPLLTSSITAMWMVIPLCLSVSIVYRTIRTEDIRKLPVQIPKLALYIIIAFAVLCAALLLIQHTFLNA